MASVCMITTSRVHINFVRQYCYCARDNNFTRVRILSAKTVLMGTTYVITTSCVRILSAKTVLMATTYVITTSSVRILSAKTGLMANFEHDNNFMRAH